MKTTDVLEKPPVQTMNEVMVAISADRKRTNLLHHYEQTALAYLVQRIPSWMTSDMLTAIGLMGSFIVSLSFILAFYFSKYFLLMGFPGFAISWFGDSLDGRLAYYRQKPRRFYRFTLDITIDWMSIIAIGCGYIIYVRGLWDILGYGFVVLYAWEMLIALMRYKLTGKYSIDSGKFGPTEARIVIAALMVLEMLIPGSIIYSTGAAVCILFIINVIDTSRLLKLADRMDKQES
jgi:hypothetical protein